MDAEQKPVVSEMDMMVNEHQHLDTSLMIKNETAELLFEDLSGKKQKTDMDL